MKLALPFVPLLAALVLAASAEAATSTATQAWQFKDDSAGGLEIDNLVGDVTIERGTAAGFHVSVKVTAEAASAQEADIIARAVEFSVQDAGSSSRLQVLLPDAKFPTIYIAGVPEGWWVRGAKTEYLGEKREVTGDKNKGVQVRVDILVQAPAEAKLEVRNRFGDTAAQDFNGELKLDSGPGRLSASNGRGKLELDSGSGLVEVSGHSGDVGADTGSGSVTISDCRCRIKADTGSGSVRINGGEGEIDADTGSGSVTVRDFKGSLAADTGSGAVSATGISGLERLVVDTGSGGLSASGDLSGLRRLKVDAGSGSVSIAASAWPAMEVAIDTGSGGVTVDVPGAEVTRHDDGSRTVRIGGGGERGVIETGSGSVELRTLSGATQ
jgi:DUF4097 and DUF4098 domain-containing protein YvlB